MIDLKQNKYLYAQALDNSGDSEFWMFDASQGAWSHLPMEDAREGLVRNSLDVLAADGRRYFRSAHVECHAFFSGLAVLKVVPTMLDIDGRVSPVLILLDVFSKHRSEGLKSLPQILERMRGKLGWEVEEQLSEFHICLRRSRFIAFISLLFSSKDR